MPSPVSTKTFEAPRPARILVDSTDPDLRELVSYHIRERSVDVAIGSLRRKLGTQGRLIGTVRWLGYQMEETPAS